MRQFCHLETGIRIVSIPSEFDVWKESQKHILNLEYLIGCTESDIIRNLTRFSLTTEYIHGAAIIYVAHSQHFDVIVGVGNSFL
jgi:hypothetical protein